VCEIDRWSVSAEHESAYKQKIAPPALPATVVMLRYLPIHSINSGKSKKEKREKTVTACSHITLALRETGFLFRVSLLSQRQTCV